MQGHELVQVAGLIATHAGVLIRSCVKFPDAALELYWTASKCRQERWARTLKSVSAKAISISFDAATSLGPRPEPVLDEVLQTEVICRVWAAICHASDRVRGSEDAGPVASSVFTGHLESRHRVLNLMVYGYQLGVEQAVRLNRCRLHHERCTDRLLALIPFAEVARFGFEPRRIAEWHRLLQDSGTRRGGLASLSTIDMCKDADSINPATPNGDLNARIASSILGCFPPAVFESDGSIMSLSRLTLFQSKPDRQGRINLENRRSGDAGDASKRSGFDPRGGRIS